MQLIKANGNQEQGIIEFSLSVRDCGYSNMRAVLEYYRRNQSQYQVYFFIEIAGNDENRIMTDSVIDCQYSHLVDWCKQQMNHMIAEGRLRKEVKEYLQWQSSRVADDSTVATVRA